MKVDEGFRPRRHTGDPRVRGAARVYVPELQRRTGCGNAALVALSGLCMGVPQDVALDGLISGGSPPDLQRIGDRADPVIVDPIRLIRDIRRR